jgi:hypothetical protein
VGNSPCHLPGDIPLRRGTSCFLSCLCFIAACLPLEGGVGEADGGSYIDKNFTKIAVSTYLMLGILIEEFKYIKRIYSYERTDLLR